ncbi:hypothetical protein QTP86_028527 [Hemibagrus guttatus]|nr:hypothetical protein QTP86_028527 [Hemibagrus guttatus]
MAAGSPLRGLTRLASAITRRRCATSSFRRNGSAAWNTALLVTLPPLSYLGYETLCRASCASAVFALDKAGEVLEQADYLYSCGETKKLYQLLLQYKDSFKGKVYRTVVRPAMLYGLETVTEEETGVRARGSRAEDVEVLFGSDKIGQD